MTTFLFLFLIYVLSGRLYSYIDIDQSQMGYRFTADIDSDGCLGQTFTAGFDAYLIGIDLLVEGDGFTAPMPYGSDFQINLRTVSPQNVISETIIATGFQSKDEIRRNETRWLRILFDEPYYQSNGEILAFTIVELGKGKGYGWNNYGMDSLNPYAGGQQFYMYSSSPLPSSNYDMAFETVVEIPESATILLITLGAIFLRQKNQSLKRIKAPDPFILKNVNSGLNKCLNF